MRRIIGSLVAVLAVIFGTLVAASPANASGVCGSYAPTRGRVTTSHNGDFIHVTAAFQLSDGQLAELRCSAEYLELSYYFSNVTIPGDSEDYSIYSNLPNATHDVGFTDSTFSPGITVIPTRQLQANYPYYGTVEFRSGVTDTPYVRVGFSPSHWSSTEGLSIRETGSCERGNVGSDMAWCIFPNDTQFLNQNYGEDVPVVDGGSYTLDPGRYDLTNVG